MNFVNKKDTIKGKLFEGNPYSGCYVYSRDKNDTVFKMGRSKNIHRRLMEHKACYPFKSEYWLQFVIVVLGPDIDTPPRPHRQKNRKTKKKNCLKKFGQKLETYVQMDSKF